MAGMQVAFCLLAYAAAAVMPVNGTLSDLDLALLPQSESVGVAGIITRVPRAAYALAGLSNRLCQSSVMQVILKSGDSASIRTSKREDNDEIRRILAYVYLVEHKAVSFSAFSTLF